ncbi:probable glucan endo-1,3-beta-glucosidase BG4 [Syzygium oleosum]|uniref:probable glucan endo-1,3-beta-glucosidase BG4 n=1 Tax=Syzygium oleosum TaxID=219896 RepID=UPI0024BB004B|nr:probable glucan endo-1,3-beta-glucosidase BG4 [Syzygium oleosum]XP_056175244.1 probable glucan endo-1,3-beta-glucosidase BG4 [Syzygium oleosum]
MALVNIILMLFTFGFLHHQMAITEARLDVGVCYGMIGDNLPSPAAVVQLYQRYNIGKLRLFDPNAAALAALRGSGIEVTLGTNNGDLQSIASSVNAAKAWFDTNVQPYMSGVKITYLSAGNEVVPGNLAQFVLPAMQNLQSVVNGYGYSGMRITTVVAASTLGTSYPPSSSTFADAARADMVGIIKFLSSNGSPLMINVYPYFAYASDPANVRLDYAQFTATTPVVQDGSLSYSNLLDAVVDAFYWAMEKEGVTGVDLVVSESGWPSAGNGNLTTPELAQTYNQNLVKRFQANAGTPKHPDRSLGGFIFAMFNENQKPAGIEQNFGLFYPDGTPVYHVF